MLTKDPANRIKCCDSIHHPWFEHHLKHQLTESEIMLHSLENIRHFHAQAKLHSAVSTLIATQLVISEDIADLTRCFIELDEDGDGELSRDEIHRGYLNSMHSDLSTEEIEQLFTYVQASLNGKISFHEFIAATIDKDILLSEKHLEQAF